jgi:hypothetical protein
MVLRVASAPEARFLYNLVRFVNEQTLPLQQIVGDTIGADVLDSMATERVFLESGALAASMTLCQAMWRELRSSEDRQALVRRVYNGIGKKAGFLQPHKSVAALALEMAGPLSEWKPVVAPQVAPAQVSESSAKRQKT